MAKGIIGDLLPTVLAGIVGYVLLDKIKDVISPGQTIVSDTTEAIKGASGKIYEDLVSRGGRDQYDQGAADARAGFLNIWTQYYKDILSNAPIGYDFKSPTKSKITPGPDVVHGGGTPYDAFLEHISTPDDPGHKYDLKILPTPNPGSGSGSSVYDYISEREAGIGYTREEGGREVTFGDGGSSGVSAGNKRNPGSKWKIT